VSPVRYVIVGVWVTLLGMLVFLYLELAHKDNELAAIKQGQQNYAHFHTQLLKTAKEAKDTEVSNNNKLRHDSPIGDVRLCVPRPNKAALPPVPGPGPSTGVGEPVPTGNQPSGEERAGPNIGPLQDALGALCDKVTGELREQQAVQ
jgi:hypothetical protein